MGGENLPFPERLIYRTADKVGLIDLMDSYTPYIENFVDDHLTLITRIVEIGSTGVVGYSLARFTYAQTPEERGSALVALFAGGFVDLCAVSMDLVNWHSKRIK